MRRESWLWRAVMAVMAAVLAVLAALVGLVGSPVFDELVDGWPHRVTLLVFIMGLILLGILAFLYQWWKSQNRVGGDSKREEVLDRESEASGGDETPPNPNRGRNPLRKESYYVTVVGVSLVVLVPASLFSPFGPYSGSSPKVTISVGYWGDFGFAQLMPEWEKAHPNIKIRLHRQRFTAHHESLEKSLGSGSGAP
jgi:hypothetical protein